MKIWIFLASTERLYMREAFINPPENKRGYKKYHNFYFFPFEKKNDTKAHNNIHLLEEVA